LLIPCNPSLRESRLELRQLRAFCHSWRRKQKFVT
jgi:hypothetical protein